MQQAFHIADRIAGHKEVSTGSTQAASSGGTMQGIVWRSPCHVAYVDLPQPAVTHPEDAIIRITASTICGSDLHLYTGDFPGATEMKDKPLGHESMGIVESVGPDVRSIKPGMRVVISFNISCGRCEYCKREEYTACDTTNPSKLQEMLYGHRTPGLFGYGHMTGGYAGGQASYIRVPFADVNCLPLPDDVPDEKALYLSDILCTSLHAVELGEVGRAKDETVAIWGLGPIGLMCCWWSKYKKAGRVIGIDCIPERLEVAKRLGCEVIDFSKEDTVKALQRMVPGGVDVAIECAGFRYAKSMVHKVERALHLETDTPEILSECITALRKWGRLSIIADYVGYANHFPIGAMMEKHLTVRGGQSPTQKHWKYVLRLLRDGELDPSFVVTHKLSLSDAPKAYETFNKKKDGMIKVFLRP